MKINKKERNDEYEKYVLKFDHILRQLDNKLFELCVRKEILKIFG